MEGGSVSGRSLSVAAAFSRGGFRSSLHKRLDVYLPRRQVYSGETTCFVPGRLERSSGILESHLATSQESYLAHRP